MRRNSEERDRRIAQEMWTLANNEPLALASLQPFGIVDRDQYKRLVDGTLLSLTLETDPNTGVWSYEFAVLDPDGGYVDDDIVEYWIGIFFGSERHFASKRSFLLSEARFTFPYHRR